MNRKAIVLLLFRYLAVAETVGVVFSQEKPSPADPGIVKQTSAVVSIPEDDEFYVGKDRVAQADIAEKVKQALKGKPPDEQVVYLKVACPVKYGAVVSVMNAIRDAGFDRIGLVTNKGNSVSESPSSGTKSPAGRDAKIPPGARSAQDKFAPLTTVIEVESADLVKLNSEAMSLPQLQIALERLLHGRSEKTVFIKAPKQMIYCDVVKVVDIVKGAGAQPIGLQVDLLK